MSKPDVDRYIGILDFYIWLPVAIQKQILGFIDEQILVASTEDNKQSLEMIRADFTEHNGGDEN